MTTLSLLKLLSYIKHNLLKKDIIDKFEKEFKKSIKNQKYNEFSTIDLKKNTSYKTYYIFSKKISELINGKQNIYSFKDLDELSNMLYDDLFKDDYLLDGVGNIYAIKTNFSQIDLLKYLKETPLVHDLVHDLPKLHNDTPQIPVYGGEPKKKSNNNISCKYNDIDTIENPEKMKVLISALCAKSAYVKLIPYYVTDKNNLVNNREKGAGWLQSKVIVQTKNEVKIYGLDIYSELPERKWEIILGYNPKPSKPFFSSLEHTVVIYKWDDNPRLLRTIDSKIINVSDGLSDAFKKKFLQVGSSTSSDFSPSPSVEATNPTSAHNIGRIQYYLLYDMITKEFYLTFRGTNFGGADEDVGPISSSLSNILLDIQIPLHKIRKIITDAERTEFNRFTNINELIMHFEALEQMNSIKKKINQSVDYLLLIIYNLLNDIKDVNNEKPHIGIELSNPMINYIISVIFKVEEVLNLLKKLLIIFIMIPPELATIDNFTKYINDFFEGVRKKLFETPLIGGYFKTKYDEIIRSDPNFFLSKICIISQYFTLCLGTDYIDNTLAYSTEVYREARVIIGGLKPTNPHINICGHSLGGGLAQYICANHENTCGYTFNPVGGKILCESVILNMGKEVNIEIPALDKPISDSYMSKSALVAVCFKIMATVSKTIDAIYTAMQNTFIGLTLKPPPPYENVKNFVVSQDVVHRVILSSDYNFHIGQLFLCSTAKDLNEYCESYFFDSSGNTQLQNNITMFHGMDGIFLLLNKIFHKSAVEIPYINPLLLCYSFKEGREPDYCNNFICYDMENNSDCDTEPADGAGSDDGAEPAGGAGSAGGGITSLTYKDKYLKYKTKYLKLKNKIIQ